MTRILLPILLLILFLPFCFCTTESHYNPDLLTLDTLLQTHPDSAYVRLQQFDTKKLERRPESALYELLNAEARYKNYFDDTVPNALRKAEEFFRSEKDSYNLMRTLYYKGLMCQNKGSNGEALVAFDEALENADDSHPLYKGKIFSAIGLVASSIQDWHLELTSAIESLRFFKEADSLIFIHNAKLSLGNAYLSNDSCTIGLKYLHELREEAIAIKDTTLLRHTLGSLGNGYLWENNFSESCKYYNELYSLDQGVGMSVKDKNLFLWAMDNSGYSKDSIEKLVNEIIKEDGKDGVFYNYYEKRNKYHDAFLSLKKEHNKLSKDYAGSAVSDTHFMLYNLAQERLKKTQKEYEVVHYRNIFIITMAILLVLGIIIVTKFSLRRKELKITELVTTIGILRQSINEMKSSPLVTSSPLLLNLLTSLDSLYGEYYRLPEESQKSNGIISYIREGIKNLQSDLTFLNELENEINISNNNLLKEVYDGMKKLTDQQRRLLIFIYYGFSNDSLCALLDIRPDALYNRKTRLKKVLDSSSSDRKHELLNKLFTRKSK